LQETKKQNNKNQPLAQQHL